MHYKQSSKAYFYIHVFKIHFCMYVTSIQCPATVLLLLENKDEIENIYILTSTVGIYIIKEMHIY